MNQLEFFYQNKQINLNDGICITKLNLHNIEYLVLFIHIQYPENHIPMSFFPFLSLEKNYNLSFHKNGKYILFFSISLSFLQTSFKLIERILVVVIIRDYSFYSFWHILFLHTTCTLIMLTGYRPSFSLSKDLKKITCKCHKPGVAKTPKVRKFKKQ